MAIAFDAASSAKQAAGATLTWSHPVAAGPDLILVAGIGTDMGVAGGNVTGAVYNSVAMTELDSHIDAGKTEVHWFYLVNPSVGTLSVVASFTDGTNPRAQIGGAQSFSGVHQSVPFGTVAKEQQDGGDTDCAVDVSSIVGDVVIGLLNCRSNATRTITIKGGGEVEDWNLQQDATDAFSLCGGAHKAGASSSTNIGFTLSSGTEWAIMGVALKIAAAVGARPQGPLGHPLVGVFGGPI